MLLHVTVSFTAKQCSILRVYYLLIHSSFSEHLGCFQVGAVMHKDTINILAQVFFVDLCSHFSWVST